MSSRIKTNIFGPIPSLYIKQVIKEIKNEFNIYINSNLLDKEECEGIICISLDYREEYKCLTLNFTRNKELSWHSWRGDYFDVLGVFNFTKLDKFIAASQELLKSSKK